MQLTISIFLLLALWYSQDVSGQCSGSKLTLAASTASRTLKYPVSGYYSNSTDCTWEIRGTGYSYLYYFLRVQWASFNVKGKMPSCSTDYVEVFVGSAFRSIGRFCSDNTAVGVKPFDMYAWDGYMRIKFHSDSANAGTGFEIRYEMRRRTSSERLGTVWSTTCMNTLNTASSGNIYSTKWPNAYSSSIFSCSHRISPVNGNRVKIVFMDFYLRPHGLFCTSSDDYVKVEGSSSLFSTKRSITDYKCGSKNPFSVYSSHEYTWLKFKRYYGGSLSYRGYVAGYIAYDDPAPPKDPAAKTWQIIVGVVFVIIIILIIVAVIVCVKMKKKRPIAAVVHYPPPPPPQARNRKSSKSSSSSSSSSSGSEDENGQKKKKEKNKNHHGQQHQQGPPPAYNAYPATQQGGYPPAQQGGYAQAHPGAYQQYPPQQVGYPPQQVGYPPQGAHPPQEAYPPQ